MLRFLRSPKSVPVRILPLLVAAACGERNSGVVDGVGIPPGGPFDGGAGGSGGGFTTTDGGLVLIDDAGNFVIPGAGGGGGTDQPVAVDQCGSGNPAGLSPEQVQALRNGGDSSGMRILYPYAGTVFPRGLAAPEVMWDGAGADAVYVHVKGPGFDYQGCLPPSGNGALTLPDAVWNTAGKQTQGAEAPYTLELSTLQGGVVRGPVRLDFVIARATLSGSIYYNSYNTAGGGGFGGGAGLPGLPGLPGGGGAPGGAGSGAIVRIRPGQPAEQFARQGTCTGCHSVSANGSRLIARELFSVSDGSVYQLTPTTPANPQPARGALNTAFVGLSPDGSVYINSAARGGVGPLLVGGAALGSTPDTDAMMYETDTGNVVPNTGIPTGAMMPTFSPDGRQVAFNDVNQGGGHALFVMDYDGAARRASNPRKVFEDPALFPGWPFSLPDNGALVFALGVERVFDGAGVGISLSIGAGPRSDLFIVDLKTGTSTLLARAMGFNSVADAQAGNTYLPFGASELHQAYYPTVSPVASGGYYWVFFDAMRNYGNKGLKRQLWGTAVRVSADGSYASDPSFPAFYVSGQDLNTANHRAFTALDPCKADGQTCKSGVDCCGGFCIFPDGSGEFDVNRTGMCSATPPQLCADNGDRCAVDTDCCNQFQVCINSVCSEVILQ